MKLSYTRSLILTLTLAVFSSFAFGAKKVVFFADGGKNNERHNHVDGNDILAAALEESKLGLKLPNTKAGQLTPKPLMEWTPWLCSVTEERNITW